MAKKYDLRRSFWALFLVVAILAVILILWRGRQASHPNILWITMDSLRADHLGCSGYHRAVTPTIDALAEEGALFTQCISQSNYTNISVPSMVTGRYPTLVNVRTPLHDLDDLFVTLAELLSEKGYATSAVLPDWPTGINQGFQKVAVLESDTDLRTQACLDLLGQLDQRPFFIWLYYWDPHAPYQPPAEFAERFGVQQPPPPLPDGVQLSPQHLERWRQSIRHREGWEMTIKMVQINEGHLTPEADYRDHLMDNYDAEIAFVDSRIKQVVGRIKELGLWDQTMVILNADHGEGFGEHGLFFHGYGLYEEEIRVPLIIKPPRSLTLAKKIEGAVRNLDIMPTILDYCGIQPPKDINGLSLRPCIEKNRTFDLPAGMESNTPEKGIHLVAYRRSGHKVIYRWDGPVELYDLVTDPGETVNLLNPLLSADGQQDAAAARREAELRQALLSTYGVDQVEDLLYTYLEEKIDPQNRERLRALGYIY